MKFMHATIQTTKFEEELAFYQDIVGLTIQLDRRSQGVNLVFLANEAGDTCIEIIDNPKAVDGARDPNFAIGFHNDDLDSLREELAAKGLDLSAIMRYLGSYEWIYRWQERYAIESLKAARDVGCLVFDLRSEFLLQRDFSALMCEDGIHPNPDGYNLISNAVKAFSIEMNQRFILIG